MRMPEEVQAVAAAVPVPRGTAGLLACLEFQPRLHDNVGVHDASGGLSYRLQRADRTRDVRPDLR